MLTPVVLLVLVAASWAAEISCPEIGTFNDNPPFDGLPLPWCTNDINPSYTMYTRSNPTDGQPFDAHSVPSVFNSSCRTVFICHGYLNDDSIYWMSDMKDAFLGREDINVVCISWGGGAIVPNYLQAASNTRTTGAYTALVINNLVINGGGASLRIWCVGHSLGSHVCGHTGMKTSLGRITGLDPAGPSFECSPDLTIGLNPGCASFVDVIHTDALALGTQRRLGHIDFYPAGGSIQPGCLAVPCSHCRAYDYMTQSIKGDCYLSRSRCNDITAITGSCSSCTCGMLPCASMGYGADTGCQRSGIFYLGISILPPFCGI